MEDTRNQYTVRFDADAIFVEVQPPNGPHWQQSIRWGAITRVCFRANRLGLADEVFVCTAEQADGYRIPLDADGGESVWAAIRAQGLFDEQLASRATRMVADLVCSPRRNNAGIIQHLPLFSPHQLPDLDGNEMVFEWDQDGPDSIVRYGDVVVWHERTGWEVYDRFEDIAAILNYRYGSQLRDLVPTSRSYYALLGDSSAATFRVEHARAALQHVPSIEAFTWFSLKQAVHANDIALIRRFLAQGGDPNIRRDPSDTNDMLLHVAARRRLPAIARMLIAAGANVNVLDGLLASPLVAALDPYLLPNARPPSGRNRIDQSALKVERTAELVQMLLLAGANVSGLDRPFSELSARQRALYKPPLQLAARYGYEDALRLLLEHGAAVDVEDGFGDTPLHLALVCGQVETTRHLVAGGADVNRVRNQPGNPANTPLLMLTTSHESDTRAKVTLISTLVAAGADVNATNTIGDTALLAAVRYGTKRRYAMTGSADGNQPVVWQIESLPVYVPLAPAHIAAIAVALCRAGANTEIRDRDGYTARELAGAAGLNNVAALL